MLSWTTRSSSCNNASSNPFPERSLLVHQCHLALCSKGLFQFGLSEESSPEPGTFKVIIAEDCSYGEPSHAWASSIIIFSLSSWRSLPVGAGDEQQCSVNVMPCKSLVPGGDGNSSTKHMLPTCARMHNYTCFQCMHRQTHIQYSILWVKNKTVYYLSQKKSLCMFTCI